MPVKHRSNGPEITIGLAQSPVSADVAANARHIRALMRQASAAGVDIVQFTEGALPGYGRKMLVPFDRWGDAEWKQLRRHAERIASLAAALRLWVIVGSAHPPSPGLRPHNCLYVIGPDGALVTRYDKRFCSRTEITGWYAPGFEPCIFTVNGVRLGCSICLDGCFPETFAEYRRLGVHVVLHSSFVAGRRDTADAEQDAVFAVRARAAAANHCYWVSMVTPSNPVQGASSQLIDPLGKVVAACRRHRRGLAIGRIDLGAGGPWQAIAWGRQWREDARCGDIYRAAATDSPRSRDRSSF